MKEILSDEEIVVSGLPSDGKIDSPAGFKIVPKIDQTKVFAKVWEALRDGECIGIFPEVYLFFNQILIFYITT